MSQNYQVMDRTSYLICGVQGKMKVWSSCSKNRKKVTLNTKYKAFPFFHGISPDLSWCLLLINGI